MIRFALTEGIDKRMWQVAGLAVCQAMGDVGRSSVWSSVALAIGKLESGRPLLMLHQMRSATDNLVWKERRLCNLRRLNGDGGRCVAGSLRSWLEGSFSRGLKASSGRQATGRDERTKAEDSDLVRSTRVVRSSRTNPFDLGMPLGHC